LVKWIDCCKGIIETRKYSSKICVIEARKYSSKICVIEARKYSSKIHSPLVPPLYCRCEAFKLVHRSECVVDIVQNRDKMTHFGKAESKCWMFRINCKARAQSVVFYVTMPNKVQLRETRIFPPSTHKFIDFTLLNIRYH